MQWYMPGKNNKNTHYCNLLHCNLITGCLWSDNCNLMYLPKHKFCSGVTKMFFLRKSTDCKCKTTCLQWFYKIVSYSFSNVLCSSQLCSGLFSYEKMFLGIQIFKNIIFLFIGVALQSTALQSNNGVSRKKQNTH